MAEQQYNKEELDYMEGVKSAAVSAGVDVATLGVGKFFKPAYMAMKKRLGFSQEEVTSEILEAQRLLMSKGATLTTS